MQTESAEAEQNGAGDQQQKVAHGARAALRCGERQNGGGRSFKMRQNGLHGSDCNLSRTAVYN
jgi:hypothetical protein